MKRLLSYMLAILLAFTFVSCAEPETPKFTVTFEGIEHVPIEVAVGEKFKLPTDLETRDGYTLIVKNGETILAAGKEYDITADTVLKCSWEKIVVKVSKVVLDKVSLELKVNNTETLKATVSPDNATEKTVTWTSANPKIATVDTDGKVTAVAEGETTITAKAGDKSATIKITVSVGIPDFITDGSLNRSIDKLFTDKILDNINIWTDMHTYLGFSMSSLPEEEITAFLNAFKERHNSDLGLIQDKTDISYTDGVMTLNLCFDNSANYYNFINLTNGPEGSWKLEYIIKNSNDEITSQRTFTFEPDENGNIRSWMRDRSDYIWQYVDTSLISIGSVITESKTIYTSNDSDISQGFKTEDFRTASEGTVISSTESFDKNGVKVSQQENVLHKNKDSSLIWTTIDEGLYSFLWNSKAPCPLNKSLTGKYPDLVKQEMLSLLSPNTEHWNSSDFKVNIINAEGMYTIAFPIISYSTDMIKTSFESAKWTKVEGPSYTIDGIQAVINDNSILFVYASQNHIAILDALMTNKPLPKDKYTVSITKPDTTVETRVVLPGSSFTIPKDIRNGVTIEDGSAFVISDGREQFFPEQRIVVNKDYNIKCEVIKGTEGLEYKNDNPDGTWIVTGYTGTAIDVVIPEKINVAGKSVPVFAIGNNVFNKPEIKSVMIPDSLTIVGSAAFADSGIEYFSAPKKLKGFDSKAFMNCQNLKKITWCGPCAPRDNTVFQGCNNIEEFVFPMNSNPNIAANLIMFFNPTPEHPITVHYTDKSVTYTEKIRPGF